MSIERVCKRSFINEGFQDLVSYFGSLFGCLFASVFVGLFGSGASSFVVALWVWD